MLIICLNVHLFLNKFSIEVWKCNKYNWFRKLTLKKSFEKADSCLLLIVNKEENPWLGNIKNISFLTLTSNIEQIFT